MQEDIQENLPEVSESMTEIIVAPPINAVSRKTLGGVRDYDKDKLKIKSVNALRERVNKYFKECDAGDKKGEPIPYTNSGLALSLGISRATLINYKNSNKFGDVIQTARTRIENSMEKRLFGKNQCVGAIFALKNSFPGWVDKNETKINGPLGDILDTIQNGKTKSFIKRRD